MTTQIRFITAFVLSVATSILFLNCENEQSTVNEGFAETEDGIELFYRRFGEGPQAIVIPAGMYLEAEFKRLARSDRSIIFYDMRGRGKSTTITDTAKLGFEYEVTDLENLRQLFGFEQMSLIGWSYLGGVVMQYALRHPEHVERIVQIGPVPPRRQPYMEANYAEIAARHDSVDLARLDSLKQIFDRGQDSERDRRAYWRILHKAMKYDADVEFTFRNDYYTLKNEKPDNVWEYHLPTIIGSFGNWDWRPELSKLDIPVLTIHGDYDSLPLQGAREWTASLPNAQLLIIPQAGHFPWAEKPEIVFPAIDDFLMGKLLQE